MSQNTVSQHNVLSVVAHPDDAEIHHSGLLVEAKSSYVLVASDGEASTLDLLHGLALSQMKSILLITTAKIAKSTRLPLGVNVSHIHLPDGEIHHEHFDALKQKDR